MKSAFAASALVLGACSTSEASSSRDATIQFDTPDASGSHESDAAVDAAALPSGWTIETGMPAEVMGRWGASIVRLSTGQALLFGGRETIVSRNDVWMFDPDDGSWTELHSGEGTAPPGRFRACATALPNDDMLVFGGRVDGFSLSDSDTWVFAKGDRTWTRIDADARPPALVGCSLATSLDGNAYLFAGGSNSGYSNETWRFDADERNWTRLAPEHSPESRYDAALIADPRTSKLWLYGGGLYGPSQGLAIAYSDLWTFDPETVRWEMVKTENGPVGRRAPVAASVEGGLLIAFGEGTGLTFFDDTWLFHVDTGRWKSLEGEGSLSARSFAGWVGGADELFGYAFGGIDSDGVVLSDCAKLNRPSP